MHLNNHIYRYIQYSFVIILPRKIENAAKTLDLRDKCDQ